mmetsp:Transcript_16150/g.18694  ORF Transcript_16150/g.18694 Transcript_16150/m.18694 type:complete len:135 (+) Transcript_16150:55-459(+)
MEAGSSGSATSKVTTTCSKLMRSTSKTSSTCSASKGKLNNYDRALDMILGQETPDSDDFSDPNYLANYEAAMDLYGLIHSRFILSPKGLALMREKFLMGTFGVCPRVKCKRHYTMPVGSSYNLNESRVKIFCPK